MSLANYVPEIWDDRLLFAFERAHVFGALVNRDYEGQIKDKGDTVRIITPGPITVQAYSGTVTYQTPQSTDQVLRITQDDYWAFEMDDLAQVQANVTLIDKYMIKAGQAAAQSVDTHLANLYTEVGLADVDVTLSSGDMYATLVTAGQRLDEKDVPREGRWAVISPAGYAKVLQTDEFIHATAAGDAVVRNAQVGQMAGFRLHVSNNLVSSTTRRYLYGTNDAITFASQLVMSEGGRRDASFKDFVRGRMAYGSKVVQPYALGQIKATE
jgi:hypothetical protein